MKNVGNPKRDFFSKNGKAAFYDFYAGYSPEFVKNAIRTLKLNANSLIMDPWNGSGTTTHVAQAMGYNSVGFDINPVMVIIAKSKQLKIDIIPSLSMLCKNILEKVKQYRKYPLMDYEPLEAWFIPATAATFRNIERAIQYLLVSNSYSYILHGEKVGLISSLAAFFYVALFRCLKNVYSHYFSTTNPTWIKRPKFNDEKVQLESNIVYDLFEKNVKQMIYQLNLSKRGSVSEMDSESCLSIGNSTAIPLDDNSVDAVITSPPYCTRIDYTIATSLELALLGYDYKEHVKDLRQSTIGSPVINKKPIELKREWGKTCLDILDKIYSHSAKASKSYYFKTYLQYFSSIYLSLIEIDRTLLNGGRCILVVQDSYYKEILVNLPIVFTEMMETLDWTLIFKEDYQCKQSMIGLNTRSNNYRSKTYTTESVLMLYKKAKEI